MMNYRHFGPRFERGEWNGPRFERGNQYQGHEHQGH